MYDVKLTWTVRCKKKKKIVAKLDKDHVQVENYQHVFQVYGQCNA